MITPVLIENKSNNGIMKNGRTKSDSVVVLLLYLLFISIPVFHLLYMVCF